MPDRTIDPVEIHALGCGSDDYSRVLCGSTSVDSGRCDAGGIEMKFRISWMLVAAALVLASCGGQNDSNDDTSLSSAEESAPSGLIVMSDDLQELKDDFNAHAGRVRLVFLNGPTCGICLRGMADLNDAFIAASQRDDRLVTFVVHVPTMGAKEHHASDSMPLLDGPRVHHYWEESGIIGQHYTDVMDVVMYVWDFWAIYGPDAVWEGTLPPVPDYYEHQLGVTSGGSRRFPRELVLDAERFAKKTSEYLQLVDTQRFANDVSFELPEQNRLADGTVIPHVGQPRNVAVRQHIMGRGGYKNLKRIQSVEAHGHIEANETSAPIVVRSERPNVIRRITSNGEDVSVAELDANGVVRLPSDHFRGLPREHEELVLASFEFDGLFVEWPDKGHEVDMLGMQKFGDVLAWQLDLIQNGGRHWHLYLDSHTGDLVRANLLDPDGNSSFIVDQSDFREVAGFRFPHQIEYLSGSGDLLARESFDRIIVDVEPFDLDQDAVTH
jgi:hypothetical protein